ncbi:MAG: hypothetical protein D6725_15165 [Planctomycetota bacterium]|nr:MAG: hypothetical protein D6725_15165 [Planctomycetota bacterium]
MGALTCWDGVWYVNIAREGYWYDPLKRSPVAFFPAYPLLGRAVARCCTGLSENAALLVVSNLAFLGSLVLLMDYVRGRWPADDAAVGMETLLVIALWPTGVFFRVAYSEALFLFVCLLAMYGMQRRWPLILLAGIVGLGTACRPVGVALIPVLLLHLWQENRRWTPFLRRAAWLLPVASWGILAYMAFQYLAFGDALAFVKTQERWRVRHAASLVHHAVNLAILEPLWSVYVPSSEAYWARWEHVRNPLFSLQFANPVYFATAAALLAYGAWRRWLSSLEVVLGAGLLLIPYLTHAYQVVMMGHGRYAVVVFPAYIVLGRLLQRIPREVLGLLCALSGFLMGSYAALLAAWYRFF